MFKTIGGTIEVSSKEQYRIGHLRPLYRPLQRLNLRSYNQQCDQIWRVPAKFGGFRHSCGGQNFGVAVGGCGGLLNKMRKMRQFFTKLPKFLAVAGNFGGIQSSWGGFAENCLVTLTMKKV